MFQTTDAAQAPPATAAPITSLTRKATETLDEKLSAIERFFRTYGDDALRFGVRVLGVILLLIAAWFLAGWLRRSIDSALRRPHLHVDLTLTKFLANFARYAVLLFALVAALGIFGIESTSFAAVLGAASLAVGLAFQGSLSNFAAGVMLLILRPFKIGDTITVGAQTGTVDEIELFSTKLDTADNRRIILPNSAVFGTTIENATHHSTRRVDLAVSTDLHADIDATRAVLLGVARSAAGRLEGKEFLVELTGLTPISIDWAVRVWATQANMGAVREALIRSLRSALAEAGLSPPTPRTRMILDRASVPGGPSAPDDPAA